MRSVAESTDSAHRGALWVISNMLQAGILSASQVVAALETMLDDPRCPVPTPKPELAVRIRRLEV